MHHRFGRGFDNIRCQTYAVEAAAVKVGDDIYLTECIFTVAFAVRLYFTSSML